MVSGTSCTDISAADLQAARVSAFRSSGQACPHPSSDRSGAQPKPSRFQNVLLLKHFLTLLGGIRHAPPIAVKAAYRNGDRNVGDFIIIFILLTGGLIILLFCLPYSPARSSASPSGSGRVYASNDQTNPVPPLVLATCGPSDPDRTFIWSTQIPALRFVCQHEPQGVCCADLKPIYLGLARHYPEIYDGHTFHEWGQSFVDLGLFRVQDKCIHITASGRALLDMLRPLRKRRTHETAWQ